MDITPYNIHYPGPRGIKQLRVKPCCKEDNVVDYAIYDEDYLMFTIARHEDGQRWIVSMKNADEDIDESTVQQIGSAIDQRNAQAGVL